MYPFISKYIYKLPTILIVFILIQGMIYTIDLVTPSVDFTAVYLPDAHNLQSHEHVFSVEKTLFTADGNIDRFGTMPPLYIYTISGIIFFGGNHFHIFLLNVIFLTVAIVFAFKLFKLITTDQHIIYISLLTIALNPIFAVLPAMAGAESLFALLMISGLYFYMQCVNRFSVLNYTIAVLLLALSVEARLINLYLIPCMFIPFLFRKHGMFIKIYTSVLAISVFVLLINQFSQPVYNYYLQRTTIDGLLHYPDNAAASYIIEQTSHVKQDFIVAYIHSAREAFLNTPGSFIKLYFQKFFASWYATDSGRLDIYIMSFQLIFFLTFLWQLAKQLFSRKRDLYIIIILFLVFYTNVIAMSSLSICRYMAPVTPLFVFLAVYSIINILRKKFTEKNVSAVEI